MASGDVDTYNQLQESERRKVLGQYGGLRQQMQIGFNQRGIGRSGFAGEALTGLANQEQGALGAVQAGINDRLINYRFQQAQTEYLRRMSEFQKEQSSGSGGWLGAALGVGGSILGGALSGLFK